MQTAAITDTVAIPRAVLSMIAFYETSGATPQQFREWSCTLLEPFWRQATGGTRRNAQQTVQEDRATRHPKKASNAVDTITQPVKATRTRKGSRREQLLELIRQNDGLSRGDILQRMGLKGDKAGEMSISNALTSLTKRNELRREGGKYLIGGDIGTLQSTRELAAAE